MYPFALENIRLMVSFSSPSFSFTWGNFYVFSHAFARMFSFFIDLQLHTASESIVYDAFYMLNITTLFSFLFLKSVLVQLKVCIFLPDYR